jgi:hypothetical protein
MKPVSLVGIEDTAVCPQCGRAGCKVREVFLQATRREPMKSLGFEGYCPDCDLAFKIKTKEN